MEVLAFLVVLAVILGLFLVFDGGDPPGPPVSF